MVPNGEGGPVVSSLKVKFYSESNKKVPKGLITPMS